MRKTNELNKKTVGADPVSAQKGITLIALIITIIVMLILVSVTIAMAVNGGLFDYAGKATSETQDAIKDEQWLANGGMQIGDIYYSIDDYLSQVTENDGSRIKLSYKVTPAEDKLSAVITVNARMLGGLIKDFEEYETWALKKLEGMSTEDKIQMFIDADVFWYSEDYSGIENVTLEDVLETWECDTIEECWQENYDSFDEALIDWKYVCPDEYEFIEYMNYYVFARKELQGKTDEEIEQIFVDGQNYWNEVENYGEPTYANIDELILYWSENYDNGPFTTVEEMCEAYEYNTLSDFAIDWWYVYPEKYYEQRDKIDDMKIHMIHPSGKTYFETNTIELTVYRDGEYTFKAFNETGTESNSITVNIDLFGYKYKVGDYVSYRPTTGNYNIEGGDYGSGYTSWQYFTTDSSLKWRILSIDEQTGQIELISEKEVHTLYLKGENGYNHGVDILNDLCETLYSKNLNNKKVATARSINVEDINAKTTYTEGNRKTQTITDASDYWYPSLYAIEMGSTVNGLNETADLLNRSEGVRTAEGKADLKSYVGESSSDTFTSTLTGFNYNVSKCLNNDLGINTAPDDLLAGSVRSTGVRYWVASRGVDDGAGESVWFGIHEVYYTNYPSSDAGWRLGCYDLKQLNMGNGARGELECSVRPVVNLDSSVSLFIDYPSSEGSEVCWGLSF